MTENNGFDNGKSADWHDAAGRFQKNNPGKPKGSSKNKLRDEIKSFLNDCWKDFPSWFIKLKEKEKIQTVLDLLPYAVPRLQNIAMTDSEGNELPRGLQVDYSKLSDTTLREIIAATTINESENGTEV